MAEKLKFRLHPLVRLFPRIQGTEREAMKQDIKEYGVRVPVLGKQKDDHVLVFDGGNRIEIVNELRSEGHEIDCPWSELEGTDEEALQRAMSQNLHRRQLSSSQRAAVAVEADSMSKRLARKRKKLEGGEAEENGDGKGEEGGEEGGEEHEGGDGDGGLGDLAEKIAEKFGTNRTYYFKAAKLKEERPDLLKDVRDGKLTLGQAEKRARLQGKDGEGEEGDEGDGGRKKDDGGEEVVKDQLGVPVPPKLLAVFATRVDFHGTCATIKAAIDSLTEVISVGPATAYLDAGDAVDALKSVANKLRQAGPYCVCPKCEGRKCGECGKNGWMNLATYRQYTRNGKKKEEEATAGAEA